MHRHVKQQAVANERGEEHKINLSPSIAIVELLLIRRPMDAAYLHRLIRAQVGDNHLRRGLGRQIHRINTYQRALSSECHILIIC